MFYYIAKHHGAAKLTIKLTIHQINEINCHSQEALILDTLQPVTLILVYLLFLLNILISAAELLAWSRCVSEQNDLGCFFPKLLTF